MAKFFIIFAVIALWTLAGRSGAASTVQILSLENQTEETSLEPAHEINADERINLLEQRIDALAKQLSDNLDVFSTGLCGNCSESNGAGETDLESYVMNWNAQIKKRHKEMSKRKTEKVIGMPRNCEEATRQTRKSDIYYIMPFTLQPPVSVYCDDTIDNGGWTVIQRRVDGSVDFNRNWEDYKAGFGDLRGEFFIGLDKLFKLTTTDVKQELYILMQSFTGETKYAKYSSFAIGNESEEYYLKELGMYRGTAGDSLREHLKFQFGTSDRQNNNYRTNCVSEKQAGWWFNAECNQITSMLNGLYMPSKNNYGIRWDTFADSGISLRFTQMMIRPSQNS